MKWLSSAFGWFSVPFYWLWKAVVFIQRSIQVEGAFGVIKQDFGFTRFHRKGLKNVKMEFLLVCLGYNLKKYDLSRIRRMKENPAGLLS